MDHEAADPPAGATETRAGRRARREAARTGLPEPLLPPLATVPRPGIVLGTVAVCGLLALAAAADAVLLAAGLAWAGVVLAWGWPGLLGSSSRFGSSLAIGVTGVLAPVLAAVTTDPPYLRFVPVAMAVGLTLMFGHQIVRRDGRPRLIDSIATTSLALALVTTGASWVPLARSERATDLLLVSLASVAVAALAGLVVGVAPLRPWLLAVAMVLGGGAAMAVAAVLGSPDLGPAALTGVLVAAVSHAVQRMLSVLPPVGYVRSQLAVAVAGVLVPGVVVHVLVRAIVG